MWLGSSGLIAVHDLATLQSVNARATREAERATRSVRSAVEVVVSGGIVSIVPQVSNVVRVSGVKK